MSQSDHPACIGIAEWDPIGPGMAATNALLAAAKVVVEQAFTAPPGRWFVMVSGEAAEVEKAIAQARSWAAPALRDAAVLPAAHPDVLRALSRAQVSSDEEAVGILETDSLVAGICAAERAVRAAPVLLLQVRLCGDLGGKSLVLVAGSQTDVEKALAAARDETDGRAATVSTVVIENVHAALRPFLIANG